MKSIIHYFINNTEIWRKIKDVKVKKCAEVDSDHYLVQIEIIATRGKMNRNIRENKFSGFRDNTHLGRKNYYERKINVYLLHWPQEPIPYMYTNDWCLGKHGRKRSSDTYDRKYKVPI